MKFHIMEIRNFIGSSNKKCSLLELERYQILSCNRSESRCCCSATGQYPGEMKFYYYYFSFNANHYKIDNTMIGHER